MELDDLPPSPSRPTSLKRRDLLRAFGAASVGAAAIGSAEASLAATRSTVLQTSCTLTPSATQGPYWLNLALLRKDITEGLPGVPLHLWLRIVDSNCVPIDGAVVDVWHNETGGKYSGYQSQGTAGQTWLRGIQVTGSDGIATFRTIYPGWYPGRTTHIHLKVNPNSTQDLTSQVYFPDSLTSRVYQLPPYDAHGQNPTKNANDGIFTPETVMGTLTTPNLGNTWLHVFAGITIVVD